MDKLSYLNKLYYHLNDQRDFYLQFQDKRNDIFYKKRSFTSLFFDNNEPKEVQKKNLWYINKANARTILSSEICIDYDIERGIMGDGLWRLFKGQVRQYLMSDQAKAFYLKTAPFGLIFDTSSSGYHTHLFNKKLLRMSYNQRVSLRLDIFKDAYLDLQDWALVNNFEFYELLNERVMFELNGRSVWQQRLKIDNQLHSEKVTINLEFATHWKTGKKKELIRKIKN